MNVISKLKENDQDFEWYPTTNEILNSIKKNISIHFGADADLDILDCGAGDGRSLDYLKCGRGSLYAIEKSSILMKEMNSDIFIVGTDFEESTLIDKKVDVVFCNPPYSQYEMWASKVISESNAAMIYLVIPKRWENSSMISSVIKQREAEVKVIGEFDFFNAERKARAQVNILSVKLYCSYRYVSDTKSNKVDPFAVWFDNYFVFNAEKEKGEYFSDDKEQFRETIQNALVEGDKLVLTLVKLFNGEMSLLCKNYEAVAKLNPSILKELGVDVSALKESLKQKIKGLKYRYWEELFRNLNVITDRLTTSSRKVMMDKLLANTSIDFTESNVYAVSIWAIKNANKYFDKQLIQLVEEMIDKANIKLYKSNNRTFGKEEWYYCRKPESLGKFSLELRIVIHNMGGISNGDYGYSWEYINNLYKRAHDFLSDICTVANNIGFSCKDDSRNFDWSSGKKVIFKTDDGLQLMEVKAYKNRNIHIKFNQDFLKKLNIEFGRLKGWLKDKYEAGEELGIPVKEVDSFGSNFQLKSYDVLLISG
jgi:hypothetical protein